MTFQLRAGIVFVPVLLLGAAAAGGGSQVMAAPPTARTSARPPDERVGSPFLGRFGADVVFYASFDEGLEAEVAPKSKEPRPGDWQAFLKGGGQLFTGGAFGQALKSDEYTVSYDLGDDPRLSQSGSIVHWIACYAPKPAETDYFWPGRLSVGKRGIMYGQQGGKGSKGPLYAYTEGLGQKVSVRQGGTAGWKDVSWHLLVVNWRSDSIEISVDGQPPSRGSLRQPVNFEGGVNGLVISVKRKAEAGGFLIDEVMVLKTPLELADIEWIQAHGPPEKITASD
jgi:hypothetical protein